MTYVPTGRAPIDPYAPIPVGSTNGPAQSSWEEPEPFDVLDVPAFPVEALPDWIREWCEAKAVAVQVPINLPCVVALTSASLATARLYRVQISKDWKETANLWTATALPPGERKSPIFSDATAPIYRFAADIGTALGPKVRERALARHVLSGQLDAAKAAAIKNKPFEGSDAMQAAKELAYRLDELPEIHTPVYVTDDVTPEALALVLAQSGERIGIFSAEGGPLEIMAGRYTERGTNFEIFLKAHSGDRHIVNRVKRDPIHLVEPILTMALTVQPSVIEGLATKDGFRGRGLLARFLYSLPQSRVGRRATNPPPMDLGAIARYDRSLYAMMKGDETKPLVLSLSPGADEVRTAFQQELEPRLGPDGNLQPIADWANKLTGTVGRIAAVLHVAENAEASPMPLEISKETVTAAVAIGGYFLEHAVAAFRLMGADEDTELAKRVWAWTIRKGLVEFTESEAKRAVHATPETIALALKVLSDRSLVRKRPPAPASGGRPPSPTYDVNPRAVRS